MYHICLIRRHGYYLFHHAILCGFYLRVATNQEQHLLIKLSVIDKVFRNAKLLWTAL